MDAAELFSFDADFVLRSDSEDDDCIETQGKSYVSMHATSHTPFDRTEQISERSCFNR